MADFVLLDGDSVLFQPTFGPATVVVRPGQLAGSGPAKAGDRAMCVEGDESRVQVAPCPYVTPQFSIPGTGSLKIQSLAPNSKATKTTTGQKPVLLVGGMFTAVFEVQSPAQQPTPTGSVPDGTPQYPGQGQFLSTNTTVQAT